MLDNRRKENLLPIIEKNVYTNSNQIMNIDFRTRIYSDCYSVYRQSDCNDMGFILHRVNHSIWFGRGSFHTNTVEGLWAAIKRITRNISGLNFKVLYDITKEGYDASKYIDDRICFSLFQRDVARKNLNEQQAWELLIECIKN